MPDLTTLEQDFTDFIEGKFGTASEDISRLAADLGEKCMNCTLLRNEINQSDTQRAVAILEDIGKSCPITVAYMGAVVSSCTVDQRLHQRELSEYKS